MIVIVPSSYSQLVCTFLTTSIICDDCNFHAKEEIDKKILPKSIDATVMILNITFK